MLLSESHTRDVQRISSVLARGGLDLLGRVGSHPGNSLVDLDGFTTGRHAMSCTGGNHTFIAVTCRVLILFLLSWVLT